MELIRFISKIIIVINRGFDILETALNISNKKCEDSNSLNNEK